MFAVAALSEAVELRENGITIPILILGYTAPECAETLSRLNRPLWTKLMLLR